MTVAAPAASMVCEIAFTTPGSAFDSLTVWTDVSADLRSVSTDRGRQYELNQFNAGAATVVLDNRAGAYDPANTSSPYYDTVQGRTQVLPMKRIRLSVVTDSAQVIIYVGYVLSYQQNYANTFDATTTLTCSDASLILNQETLDTSFYPYLVKSDGARFYYRLGEAQGATSVSDSVSGQTLAAVGAGVLGGAGLLPYDTDGAYTLPAGAASVGNFLYNPSANVAVKGVGGTQSLVMGGTSTTAAVVSTPHVSALAGMTAVDGRVRFTSANWTAGQNGYLLNKGLIVQVANTPGTIPPYHTTGAVTFQLEIRGTRVSAQIGGAPLAGTPTTQITPFVAFTPPANNVATWLGFTAVPSGTNWTVNIYQHSDVSVPSDITTWTLLQATVLTTGVTTLPSDTSSNLCVGNASNTGAYPGGAFFFPAQNFSVLGAAVRSSVNGTIVADPDFTTTPWVPGDTSGAARADGTGKTWTIHGPDVVQGTATPFSVEATIKWDTTQTVAGHNWLIAGQGDGHNGWYLLLDTLNNPELLVMQNGSVAAFAVSTNNIADGNAHHLVGTYDATGTPVLYIDGVNATTNTLAFSVPLTGNGFGIGLASQLAGFGLFSWSGGIDEVSVYPAALTSTQVAAHYAAAFTPGKGQTPAQRIAAALALAGWDGTKENLDGGSVLLQAGGFTGTLLEYLQRIAQSDQGLGILFVDRQGQVVFQDAVHDWDHDTPVLTLTQDNFSDVQVEYDDTNIRNVVAVTRTGGAAQQVTDSGSVDDFLAHSYAATGLEMDTDQTALNAANLILSLYAQPAQRITQITVNRQGAALASNAAYDALLTADIGDTIEVKYTPPGGVALDTLYTIEGVKHSTDSDPADWTITFQLAPSVAGILAAPPVTWVYLNTHFATWSAISPRTWSNPTL